jgi:serine-type D-Ala-D-Ala carboxypeptidase (penicillin-binding protein 5/6)
MVTLALVVCAGAFLGSATLARADALSPPTVGSPSAVLMDAVTGRILYSKDAHHHRQMASCTKIMTVLLALQRLGPDRILRVPKFGPERPGTTLGLRTGETISVENAARALMLLSANDAGLTLASGVSGSQARFVKLMNARAAAWGLKDTHYDNCTGHLADPHHYTSAYDLAILARRAMRNARFAAVVALRSSVITWSPGRTATVYNMNQLLAQPWADGVKAGVTKSARNCLVGSGRPGLRELITVTLHAPARALGLADTLAMFQYGSSLFEERSLVHAGDVLGTLDAADGGTFSVAAEGDVSAVLRIGAELSRVLAMARPLATAPPQGTVVGRVVFQADGVVVGATDLVVAP